MPPCVLRSFSRDVSPSTIYKGFGSQLPDHLGPLLTKGSWSAEVAQGLADAVDPSDIMIDKVRISGFWSTRLETVLRARGINTLFLSGVNTDQWSVYHEDIMLILALCPHSWMRIVSASILYW